MTELLLLLILSVLFCVVPIETRTAASYTASCPYPHLENGRARVRQRTRSVRFLCNLGFELVGSRYATCRGGEWDEPIPICIRPGCSRPNIPAHNIIAVSSRDDAWFMFFCYPGQTLVGSPNIYCDGRKWNATVPTCHQDTSRPQQLSCDFEAQDLCGWRQDELHDFDWKRLSLKTPSSFAFTGPSFDHTLGQGKQGYYMYIESSSRSNNDSARLISPIFDASLSKDGCFSFFYHMFGKTIGGLRVYQVADSQKIMNMTDAERPEFLLFEKWGNQDNIWFRNVSKLKEMTTDFQIVIEGIRGPSFTSDIAIDDVAILQGEQCREAAATAVTPPEFIPESCAGRCDLFGNPSHERGCGCTVSCVTDDNCCGDFFEICVYNSATTSDGDDDSSVDVPRTEKLIGSPTTTPKPTTALKTTTKTITTVEPKTTLKTTAVTKPTKPTTRATTKMTTPPTTVKITKAATVAPKTTIKTSTTKVPSTIKYAATTIIHKGTTISWEKLEADKARKEKDLEAKRVVLEKPKASSSAAVVTTLALAACLAAAALVALRTARGQAALARLRGRAASDPEVRYLTRDDE